MAIIASPEPSLTSDGNYSSPEPPLTGEATIATPEPLLTSKATVAPPEPPDSHCITGQNSHSESGKAW